MTALFLPDMLVRRHGHILNVSSAADSDRPTASPGLASETLLLAWTEALAKELAGSPVTVAAFVNPACGGDALAGTGATPLRDESSPDNPALTPRALADAAYDALLAGHPHITAATGMAQPYPSLAQHHARPRRCVPTARRSLG